ncbi:4Fe-4S dicluster domain-containing protein [Prosthecochloris sp. ZM_2]|uniref:Coenzyme F420 hydrogenase/dehydrogenase, beta subunit C-terminal domain n=1 Tax=Prosthecochloris sp. ZM_2 TaxID=2045206 RepID=UPI000DF85085|nr:Coenzyme F420 hydrogenase/dehydrogenase, beta subunit C-terminal domain [Prosthecochloris sp. ZM_2]RNA65328.1 4Fe-4S dicluster domain-containing protein [Prosthecochloris sp. ZM_2]
MSKRDIRYVVDNRLCLSCGACAAACSRKSISFHETPGGYLYPEIDFATCVHCELCLDVCPGIHYIPQIHDTYLKASHSDSIQNALVGRATDDKVYYNGQSGGVVTALLEDILERHVVDAVLCAGMSYFSPPRGEALLIADANDLGKSQKSKYVPVPLLENLRDYLKHYKSIAVVGLPCHMHGLELLKKVIPDLEDKIPLRIGLICDRILTAKSIDWLAKQATVKPVSHIIYRDKSRSGYPGDPSIEASDGEIIMLKAADRMAIKDFFTLVRCRLCLDKMNAGADIVCGDPHGIDGVNRVHGETLVLVRSKRGKKIIDDAVGEGVIKLRSVSVSKAINGQYIDQRVKDWKAYLLAWKGLKMPLPDGAENLQGNGKTGIKLYENNLQQGLLLDSYESVNEMLKAADSWLKKKRLKRVMGVPLRFVQKVVKKIKNV